MLALGGLGLFLFGLNLAATHLQALAGASLSRLLRLARRAPVVGVLCGAGVTALAQSGTAVGLMTLSFAEAGLLGVREGIAVMLGGAVGGTLAVQLASLHVTGAAVPLVGVGYLLTLGRPSAARHAGWAMIGLGLTFLGLETLVGALAPVRDAPLVREVLEALSGSPLALAGLGAALTLAVHSSNAPAVLAVGLVASGAIPLPAAVAFVVGANVGTPVNVYLLAAGKGVVARRAAAGHLALKVAAALGALALLGPASAAIAALGGDATRRVANAHTLFNLAAALACLPLLGLTDALLRRLIPDPEERGTRPQYLDANALDTPALAYALAYREVTRVADHVLEMARAALEAVGRDRAAIERVRREEEIVDVLVHQVVVYLARVGTGPPDRSVQALLTVCTGLEAIGDLFKRLLRQDEKLRAKGLRLSPEGRRELGEVAERTLERARLVLTALSIGDAEGAARVAGERAALRDAIETSRAAHLARLRAGREESELTSAVHLDTLTILEQVNAELDGVALQVARLTARLSGRGEEGARL